MQETNNKPLYTYIFQKEKKIDAKTTRLANVTVFTEKGKEIGREAVSKYEKVEDVVKMIVREYELRIFFNSKKIKTVCHANNR